jgi:hypothetical protein
MPPMMVSAGEQQRHLGRGDGDDVVAALAAPQEERAEEGREPTATKPIQATTRGRT